MNEIIKLAESNQKYEDYDVDELCFHKLEGGETEAGSIVEIIWDDYGKDYPEIGYLFELPGICTPDEADIFVHIPKPQNPEGKDTPPPVFIHLYDILTNEKVVSVTIRSIP
jgi:hypothetical protein